MPLLPRFPAEIYRRYRTVYKANVSVRASGEGGWGLGMASPQELSFYGGPSPHLGRQVPTISSIIDLPLWRVRAFLPSHALEETHLEE